MFDAARLVGLIPTSLTCRDAVELQAALRGVATVRAALDGYEAKLLAALVAAPKADGDGAVGAAAWLRQATGTSQREAGRKVELAKGLARLPEAAEALSNGTVTTEHAGALARAARQCPAVAEQAGELVALAEQMPADEFERELRTWVRDHTEDGGAAEHERLRARRRLHEFTTDDGMTALDVRLDPVTGAEVVEALDRLAEQLWQNDVGDARRVGLAVRRADALLEACRRAVAVDPTGQPTAGGGPTFLVLIDHQTLQCDVAAHPICQLADGTPLSPATARRLACGARLLPVVLDGASQPLDLGRSRRFPTRAQRLALLVRDGPTCVFPGCDRPISWTNVHHFVPWEHGGPTNLDHLGHLCDPHHHLAHEGGWKLSRHEDGRITAISPGGTVLTAPPRSRGRPSGAPPGPDPAEQLTMQGCARAMTAAGVTSRRVSRRSWLGFEHSLQALLLRVRGTIHARSGSVSACASRRWKAGSPSLGSAATTTLQP